MSAESEVSAFAAWTLFRKTADRRALVWLGQEQWPNPDADMLSRRKFLQFALNLFWIRAACTRFRHAPDYITLKVCIMGRLTFFDFF